MNALLVDYRMRLAARAGDVEAIEDEIDEGLAGLVEQLAVELLAWRGRGLRPRVAQLQVLVSEAAGGDSLRSQ